MALTNDEISFELNLDTTQVKKDAQKLNKELNAIFNVTGDKQLSSKISGITNRIEKQQYKLAKLNQGLSKSTEQAYTKDFETLQKKADSLFKQIQNKTGDIARWREQGYVGHGRGKYTDEKMEAHIAQTETAVERLKVKLEGVRGEMSKLEEKGKAFTFKGNEEEITEIQAKMSFLEKELQTNINKLYEADNALAQQVANSDELNISLQQVDGNAQSIAQTFTEMQDEQYMANLSDNIGEANQNMNGFVQTFIKLQYLKQLPEELKNTFKQLGKIISSIADKIAGLAMKGLKKIGTGIKNITKQMLKLNKASDSHELSLKRITNTMLKYGLGIRSVFILWRKLRTYAGDALKLMAQQFEEIDETVSRIVNSFNQFKNSVGTLVEPLMTTFAPALESILGLLVQANEALANFFAILTGQKYIYRAKKSNESYAESLKKVSDSAKDAVEDIAAYDKLLVINRDDANKYGSGNGDDDGLVDAFERTAAQSKFAEMVKEAIANDDWEGVGALFADKMNVVVLSLDNWITDDFAPKAVTWAERLGRTLNGGIAEFNWEQLGKTVGDGVNAISDAMNKFLTTFNGFEFGKSIATSINSFFDTVRWEDLGRTFANKLNLIFSTAYGFLSTLNFGGMGTNLGEFIGGWVSTVNWDNIGLVIASGLNGLVLFLNNAVKRIPWKGVGKGIADAIGAFFGDNEEGGFNAEELGDLIVNAILGAIDLVYSFFSNMNDNDTFRKIGEKIGELFEKIPWTEILGGLTAIIFEALKGAIAAISGMISKDPRIGLVLMGIAGAMLLKLKFSLGVGSAFITSLGTLLNAGFTSALLVGLAAFTGFNIGKYLYENMPAVQDWADSVVTAVMGELDGTGKEMRKKQKEQEQKLKENNGLFPSETGHGGGASSTMPGSMKRGHNGSIIASYRIDVPQNDFVKLAAMKADIDYLYNDGKPRITTIEANTEKVGLLDIFLAKILAPKDRTVTETANTPNMGLFDIFLMKLLAPKDRTVSATAQTPNVTLFDLFKVKLDMLKSKIVTATANTADTFKFTVFGEMLNGLRDKTVKVDVDLPSESSVASDVDGLLDTIKQHINENFIDKFNGIGQVASTLGGLGKTLFGAFKIPQLAEGAVIPANREFLAVLGDQKQGTNIEAPLDTIVQAMQIALANSGGGQHEPIVLQLNGRTVAETVWNETEKRYKQTGVR